MKKQLFFVLLAVPATFIGYAQGTIDFANIGPAGSGLDAPVYESDGTTKCSGTQFMVELLAGTTESSLVSVASTEFLQGTAAGYFNGGTISLPGISQGTAWVQVRIWNTFSGASFLQAQASGTPDSWWQSAAFTAQAGAPFQGIPGLLTGLGNSPVYVNSVPEPSSFGLIALGIVAALFGNNRRHRTAT